MVLFLSSMRIGQSSAVHRPCHLYEQARWLSQFENMCNLMKIVTDGENLSPYSGIFRQKSHCVCCGKGKYKQLT